MYTFDRQIDRILIARPRLHSMPHSKNEAACACRQLRPFSLGLHVGNTMRIKAGTERAGVARLYVLYMWTYVFSSRIK